MYGLDIVSTVSSGVHVPEFGLHGMSVGYPSEDDRMHFVDLRAEIDDDDAREMLNMEGELSESR